MYHTPTIVFHLQSHVIVVVTISDTRLFNIGYIVSDFYRIRRANCVKVSSLRIYRLLLRGNAVS